MPGALRLAGRSNRMRSRIWQIALKQSLFCLSSCLAALWVPGSGSASVPAARICDEAATIAAGETGVPVAVLRSITRTETGRARAGVLQPWPWTVNMEGTGKWFETEDEARAYVFRHFKRGARSFDVGCFQINYKWHGQAFRSIDEMFDPLANARYAAAFLNRLHAETGDWSQAAGAYHSRTPEYARRYRSRFDRIRRDMQRQPPPDVPVIAQVQPAPKPPRQNSYPLLQQVAQSGTRGSLVPRGLSGARALIPFGEGS